MEFSKVYIEWIKYLKNRGLYVKYRVVYSSVANYLERRNAAIADGTYWTDRYNRRAKIPNVYTINSKDPLMYRGYAMSFDNIVSAMRDMDHHSMFMENPYRHICWLDIAYKYGEDTGLIPKQKEKELEPDKFWSSISTAEIARSTQIARNRFDRAHEGQWYDRLNGGNRRRNNFNNNNIRWRR